MALQQEVQLSKALKCKFCWEHWTILCITYLFFKKRTAKGISRKIFTFNTDVCIGNRVINENLHGCLWEDIHKICKIRLQYGNHGLKNWPFPSPTTHAKSHGLKDIYLKQKVVSKATRKGEIAF